MSRRRSAFWGGLIGGALGPTAGRLVRRLAGRVGKAVLFGALLLFGQLYRWTGSARLSLLLMVLAVAGLVVLVALARSGRRPTWPTLPAPRVRYEREPLPDWLRQEIIERDGGICGICGFRCTDPARIHIDHIQPVHAGGTNDPSNLQVAHDDCNLRKGGVVGWVPPYRRSEA